MLQGDVFVLFSIKSERERKRNHIEKFLRTKYSFTFALSTSSTILMRYTTALDINVF